MSRESPVTADQTQARSFQGRQRYRHQRAEPEHQHCAEDTEEQHSAERLRIHTVAGPHGQHEPRDAERRERQRHHTHHRDGGQHMTQRSPRPPGQQEAAPCDRGEHRGRFIGGHRVSLSTRPLLRDEAEYSRKVVLAPPSIRHVDPVTAPPVEWSAEVMHLELNNVTKTYRGGKQAVTDISMRIGPGILGLLGPNGAGKSSLMRILSTITRPTTGTVMWNGTDIVARPEPLRRVLGYLPQDFGVYPNLSAREFLRYLAAVKGLTARSARERIDELLELVNLTDTGSRPLGKFSGGMRQRVGIAQALLGDPPELLIVDEPTVGLDPRNVCGSATCSGDLANDRIVILSTHIVSDIEAVAGDIAILTAGELRRVAPPPRNFSVPRTVWCGKRWFPAMPWPRSGNERR